MTILGGVVQWFFSSPTVLEVVFMYSSVVAVLFSIVGYATREE